jgi:hypothetical protein
VTFVSAKRSMVGYALWSAGDHVLRETELSMLAVLLNLPAHSLMIFLRLATRTQTYFPLVRLRQTYNPDGSVKRSNNVDAARGDVGASTDEDEQDADSANGPAQDVGFAINGKLFFGPAGAQIGIDAAVTDLVNAGVLSRITLSELVARDLVAGKNTPSDASNIRSLIHAVCRVRDLQEMLLLAGVDVTSELTKARHLQEMQLRKDGSKPAEKSSDAKRKPPRAEAAGKLHSARPSGGKMSDTNASRFSGGNSAVLNLGKDLLVDIAVAHAPTLALGSWDHVIGDLVSVSPESVEALKVVAEIFVLITGFAPETTQHGGSTPPPLPATSAILASVRAASFPVQLPYLPCRLTLSGEGRAFAATLTPPPPSQSHGAQIPSSDADDLAALADPHSHCPRPMRLCVYPTRTHLDLCLEAQRVEQRLFYLVEDEGRRDRHTPEYVDEVNQLAAAVRRGISSSEALLTAISPTPGHNRPKSFAPRPPSEEDGAAEQSSGWPAMSDADVECLFLSRDASLTADGPTTDAWAPSGLEGAFLASRYDHLVTLLPTYRFLQCAARVAEAFEAVKNYEGAVFFYRLVLNARVEVRRKWHDDEAKTTLLKSRSVPFQLRKRGEWHHRLVTDLARHLNRVTSALEHCDALYGVEIDSPKIGISDSRAGAAQRNPASLILPDEIRRTIRRSDRLAIDRVMQRLYQPPRRWSALPVDLLLKTLREPPNVFIQCKRDGATREWLETPDGSGRVEAAALLWYMRGRGPRRDPGWHGVHCEGGWMSAFFAVALHEALYSTVAWDAAVYLSPFQLTPLDFGLPGAFAARRATVIEAALTELESMRQAEFVAKVHAYIEHHRGEASDFVPWDLQMLDMAECVPLRPLAALFRAFVRQTDGHYIRFSGVPDLCLYRKLTDVPRRTMSGIIARASTSDEGYARSSTFLLCEVKGPNDRLSEKQRSMNDLMLRCGFDVEVCYVADMDDPKSHPLQSKLSAGPRGGVVVNGDASSESETDSDENNHTPSGAKRTKPAAVVSAAAAAVTRPRPPVLPASMGITNRSSSDNLIWQRRATPHSPTSR